MLGLQSLAKKFFGTQNEREIKSILPLVDQINGFESEIKKLSDEQLRGKTSEFKARFAKGETLEDLLPEAFAVVREGSVRALGMRHYDVQLIGGITLHRGRISEMKTGEGKTLVATLPAYLNAIAGKGVHVITVNDYLARRDSEWMGQVYRFLGMKVGIIVHGLNDRERKENYAADITYGTNNEFGFDYLRDNMKFRIEDYVQRDLNFCIIDEVDSILIDEARTPLIISGPSQDSTDLYYKIDQKIREGGGLNKEDHYTLDEKSKTAALTESGVEIMEKRLGIDNLYNPQNIETLHHVNQALRAHVIFKKDVDYVVRDGSVLIVDEFTGRLMPGRRWSDGLHQAVEAKEGVKIENENQTLASITFQNYFRMYNKLAGMTGTADTEAVEFRQIYNLEVTIIPTNRPMVREDLQDMIYKSEEAKFEAIADEIEERHKNGQPILIGTVSIEKSEKLSRLLKGKNVAHNILNAKQHEREAEIIAQAGRKGSLTIATNMAGRGTDIVLGGNAESMAEAEVGHLPAGASEQEIEEHTKKLESVKQRWEAHCAQEKEEVKAAGGLFILGTERHESRRIDNQLRGRAGRQGDPGGSRFYLSLDDDLMRIFGGGKIQKFMEDDLPIEHTWINRAIENAQRKVEGHNYDIRKHLLKYDDVMNDQRKVIYAWRKEVLSRSNLREMVFSMVEELSHTIAHDFFPGGRLARNAEGHRDLDLDGLNDAIRVMFQIRVNIDENDIDPFNDNGLRALIMRLAEEAYTQKEKDLTEPTMREIEKMILLTSIDQLWKDHLLAMDHLREGIGLRGYAQKDPLVEYKKEGFRFFEMMMQQITSEVIRKLFAVQLSQQQRDPMPLMKAPSPARRMQYNLAADGSLVPQKDPLMNPQGAGLMSPPTANRRPRQHAHQASMQAAGAGGGMSARMSVQPVLSGQDKVGRNDPCPCGSGKKHKKCHGEI
jgi:preprotein translocase subunit SecA